MTECNLRSHTYDGRYMELRCVQEPVAAENKSLIHWTLTVAGGNANYYTTGPTTVKIHGKTVYFASTAYWNDKQFPAAKGSVSGQLEVFHREDGSQTVECSLETAIYTGVVKTATTTWELEEIGRATTVAATDCTIGGTSMVLLDRKNSACTHTVALYADTFMGYLRTDGTLNAQPVQLEATAIALKIPLSFFGIIPEARKLECRLVCTTFLESVQVGEPQECTFFAACGENALPSLRAEVTDCNEKTLALTADPQVLVRFFSRANCWLEAVGSNGAYIAKKQVDNVEITGESVVLDGVETGTFRFLATDSRGYQTEKVVEKPLIPYSKLTVKASPRRQESISDRVELTISGNCWNGNFGAADNSLTGLCRVGQVETPLTFVRQGDDYTAVALLEGLPYDSTRHVQVEVEDALMQVSLPVIVYPGVPVFDWGQKEFAFHVPVILHDGSPAVSKTELLALLTEWKNGGTV